MKKKIYSLESYRGFAALMIAAIHFDLNSPLVNHHLANGYFVHFFFTLSGFVIFYNYFDKISNTTELLNFSKKRFFRLYPLHLFFLLIFVMIEISRFVLSEKFGIVSNIKPFSTNNFLTFTGNIFLLHTFFGENSFNTPSWSISAEFYTYILFAALIIYKLKNILLILIIILTFVIRLTDGVNFGISSTTYISFLDCIYCFFIGALFCKTYLYFHKNYFFNKIYKYFSILFIFISVIAITNLKDQYLFLIPFVFGSLILFSANLDNTNLIGKILCSKVGTYLGKISYSIYMSHLFVFWSVTQILRFLFKVNVKIENETGFTKLDLNVFESSLLVLVCYSLTIIFSHFTYKFVELKFYKKT